MRRIKEAILKNMILTFEHLSGNGPLVRFERTEAVNRIETDLPFPVFNRVLDYTASEDRDVDADVKSIANSYRKRGMKCGWHTYSHKQDEAVIEALQANGFVHAGSMSGMALSLEGRDFPPAEVPGLHIRTIHTDEELDHFKRVFIAEYRLPDDAAADVTRVFAYDRTGTRSTRYYLAYLNGEPAGTLMTFGEGDVAGIYTVATLREFRLRGIGSALVAHALRDMRNSGAKLAILQASSMGLSLYRKLGFEEELTINVYSG